MGYTTDFEGSFELDKPLTVEHACYLARFSGTRRMKRAERTTEGRPDPHREAVGLPVGVEGGYFVGEGGFAGQGERGFGTRPEDVADYNVPPSGQPGLWCQWVPFTKERTLRLTSVDEGPEEGAVYDRIVWDGGEKFYSYVEWLEYLIAHFLEPWGYALSGEVTWRGEERDDIGKIVVADNQVSVKRGAMHWE